MTVKTKAAIVNLTNVVMLVIVGLIILFFIGFIISMTFSLNVFTEKTSTFIITFMSSAFGLILCSAILNISLNISIIADSKVFEMQPGAKTVINKKYILIFIGIIACLVIVLFAGDFITRYYEKSKLIRQADELTIRYDQSIKSIPSALRDTNIIEKIPETLKLLSNQSSSYNSVQIILSDTYDGQLTFISIDPHDSEKKLKEKYFGNSFYKCDDDCSYLKEYFSGNTNESFFWTENSEYKYYKPFEIDGIKFILLFEEREQFGRIGSS